MTCQDELTHMQGMYKRQFDISVKLQANLTDIRAVTLEQAARIEELERKLSICSEYADKVRDELVAAQQWDDFRKIQIERLQAQQGGDDDGL